MPLPLTRNKITPFVLFIFWWEKKNFFFPPVGTRKKIRELLRQPPKYKQRTQLAVFIFFSSFLLNLFIFVSEEINNVGSSTGQDPWQKTGGGKTELTR
jgi:hypothetical protein